jgi:hypothetical protein
MRRIALACVLRFRQFDRLLRLPAHQGPVQRFRPSGPRWRGGNERGHYERADGHAGRRGGVFTSPLNSGITPKLLSMTILRSGFGAFRGRLSTPSLSHSGSISRRFCTLLET